MATKDGVEGNKIQRFYDPLGYANWIDATARDAASEGSTGSSASGSSVNGDLGDHTAQYSNNRSWSVEGEQEEEEDADGEYNDGTGREQLRNKWLRSQELSGAGTPIGDLDPNETVGNDSAVQ